jgi:RNA polymerase sigma factor for flagellar operon FliA
MGESITLDSEEVLERFNAHLNLVEIVARQIKKSIGAEIELDDLRSHAREGLLDAARRYDATRGVPFAAYAKLRIRGATIDGVRALSRFSRRVHERLNGLEAAARYSEGIAEEVLSVREPGAPESRVHADRALGDHLAGMATAIAAGLVAQTALQGDGEAVAISRAPDPEASLGLAQLAESLREAIAMLPKEEAELVRRHYLEGERFDHVAAELGLSKSWASRLHTRALVRLAKRLGAAQG